MVNPAHFLSLLFRYGRDVTFCTRLRRLVTVEWIRPCVRSATRILEIGAGDGHTICFLARRFPDKRFTACELDTRQLARLRSRLTQHRLKNVTIVESDFAAFASDEDFDFVYAVDVLEHVADDVGFLAAIRRRLVPGGRSFLHVPTPGLEIFHDPDHVREGYEPAELRVLLEKAGFQVERMEYTFGRRGLDSHHSKVNMSRVRLALTYLLDVADPEKIKSEIGVIARRAE